MQLSPVIQKWIVLFSEAHCEGIEGKSETPTTKISGMREFLVFCSI